MNTRVGVIADLDLSKQSIGCRAALLLMPDVMIDGYLLCAFVAQPRASLYLNSRTADAFQPERGLSFLSQAWAFRQGIFFSLFPVYLLKQTRTVELAKAASVKTYGNATV